MALSPTRGERTPLYKPVVGPRDSESSGDTENEAIARTGPRELSPRERAARRAEELRGNGSLEHDGVDEFYIDPREIPDGWSYEWKTWDVYNQEQTTEILAYRRSGWEEVPTSRHPEMMPLGTSEPFVKRKGMVLMERPKEITEEARQRSMRDAREQVRGKERSLSSDAAGAFEETRAKLGRSYEAMPVPDA